MKIYLVELIDIDVLNKLKEKFTITNVLEESDIVITRNLKVDKRFIDKAKLLKCIAIHGTGISEVDINYAKEKGIIVFNAPYQNYLSVAEFNIMLALEASRYNGVGNNLTNKNATILGAGHIGLKTKELLENGFNVNCKLYRRNDDLKEALKDSDFIFICMSLNDSTYHFFNEETLKFIKNGAVLINTARGDIVDEKALIPYLDNGHIKCYASDVFSADPLKDDNPILLHNVIGYPHIASNTKEALSNIGSCLYEQIIDFTNGLKPKHLL